MAILQRVAGHNRFFNSRKAQNERGARLNRRLFRLFAVKIRPSFAAFLSALLVICFHTHEAKAQAPLNEVTEDQIVEAEKSRMGDDPASGLFNVCPIQIPQDGLRGGEREILLYLKAVTDAMVKSGDIEKFFDECNQEIRAQFPDGDAPFIEMSYLDGRPLDGVFDSLTSSIVLYGIKGALIFERYAGKNPGRAGPSIGMNTDKDTVFVITGTAAAELSVIQSLGLDLRQSRGNDLDIDLYDGSVIYTSGDIVSISILHYDEAEEVIFSFYPGGKLRSIFYMEFQEAVQREKLSPSKRLWTARLVKRFSMWKTNGDLFKEGAIEESIPIILSNTKCSENK